MEGRYYRKQPGSGVIPARFRTKGFIIGSVIALPILFYVLFGSHGVVQRIQLETRISELHRKIEREELGNEQLRALAKALDADLKAIEKVAREKYAMAREGETVYRIKSEVGSRKSE